MKTILAITVALLLSGVARAEWKDLKPGMDRKAVMTAAGMPLIQNRGRGGAEVWTYDACGYVQFVGGQVVFWEVPKTVQAAAIAARARAAIPVAVVKPAPALNPATLPGHVVALKD